MTSNLLYTNEQIRAIEAAVINQGALSGFAMMTHAASAAWQALQKRWPTAKRIAVCVGKGNNAGDGYLVAFNAANAGCDVTIFAAFSPEKLQGDAKKAAKQCQAIKLPIHVVKTLPDLNNFDVIVDALLGIGLSGNVRAPYHGMIEAINNSDKPVLAIDVPSGINANTGAVGGVAIQADVTVTMIAFKQGLFTGQAPAYCGELLVNDLSIPEEIIAPVEHDAELLQWQRLKELLPKRRVDSHKGHYGHVLVIGGDYGMGGAVRMASEAAMRVGAGLVSVATRPEHVTVVNCSRPEIMCHKVTSAGDLEALLSRATVIVIGPGLGKSEWSISLLNRILETDHDKVLDADALNLLSQTSTKNNHWVLTPHPGEAAMLLGVKSKDIQQDRFFAARECQKRYGGVVVLKGLGTLVQGKDAIAKICPAGNPGMATGGMGDILSGVIGGLLAQGLEIEEAAELGVLVHSMAADRAAEQGGERGMLASDLMEHLRKIVNPE